MNALLSRHTTNESGVFGHLYLRNEAGETVAHFCTAEDDWLDNRPTVSCVPTGHYVCRRTIYHKHGISTFEITGVSGRSHILFHPGNTEEDSQGCVLLGREFGQLTVKDEDDPKHKPTLKWGVTQSKAAFADFMKRLDGIDEFPLDIVWSKPGMEQAA